MTLKDLAEWCATRIAKHGPATEVLVDFKYAYLVLYEKKPWQEAVLADDVGESDAVSLGSYEY